MIVIRDRRIVFCDVDDTLVMWSSTSEEKQKEGVLIHCPESITYTEDNHTVNVEKWSETLVPNKANIEQIKKHKLIGHTVVVWSAGGFDWAESVIRSLGLEKYVDVVMSKPNWFIDDLPASEFMPEINRIYKK